MSFNKYNNLLEKYNGFEITYKNKKIIINVRETYPRNSNISNGITFDIDPKSNLPNNKRGQFNGYYRMVWDQKNFNEKTIEKNINKLCSKCKEIIDKENSTEPEINSSENIKALNAIKKEVDVDIFSERAHFSNNDSVVTEIEYDKEYYVNCKIRLKKDDTIRFLRYIAAISQDKALIKKTL